MDKAVFIARMMAQLAAEYTNELARVAERQGKTDFAVHGEVQKQITENEAQALRNSLYFKSKLLTQPTKS